MTITNETQAAFFKNLKAACRNLIDGEQGKIIKKVEDAAKEAAEKNENGSKVDVIIHLPIFYSEGKGLRCSGAEITERRISKDSNKMEEDITSDSTPSLFPEEDEDAANPAPESAPQLRIAKSCMPKGGAK